jgi:hypothetical protein
MGTEIANEQDEDAEPLRSQSDLLKELCRGTPGFALNIPFAHKVRSLPKKPAN